MRQAKHLIVFERSETINSLGIKSVNVDRNKHKKLMLKNRGVDEAIAEARSLLSKKKLVVRTININTDGDVVAVVSRDS